MDGQDTVIGGTSAVAPLWAGLIAVANQQLGTQVGFIQPAIYAAKAAAAFTDITQGNNGAFSAGTGWDACAGLGSPIAAKLIPLLAPTGTVPASTPTTPASGGWPVSDRQQKWVPHVSLLRHGRPSLFPVGGHLLQQPLPGFLVFAEAALQVFENSFEIGVGAEIVPGGILLEPGVVFVA